jgi:hypothetical protein
LRGCGQVPAEQCELAGKIRQMPGKNFVKTF